MCLDRQTAAARAEAAVTAAETAAAEGHDAARLLAEATEAAQRFALQVAALPDTARLVRLAARERIRLRRAVHTADQLALRLRRLARSAS